MDIGQCGPSSAVCMYDLKTGIYRSVGKYKRLQDALVAGHQFTDGFMLRAVCDRAGSTAEYLIVLSLYVL